jgi:hypothetical protein
MPVLAAMIQLAPALPQPGDDGAARTGRVLSQVLAYLRAASAELPRGSGDHLVALFLQAEACLLRDADVGPVPDLDDAIGCLRKLRDGLPAGDQSLPEIDAKLGCALFTRAGRSGARLTDVDEAGVLLTSVLDRMAPDDPDRPQITSVLATQRAVRYAGFGGTEDDRDAALGYAMSLLENAGEAADTGHLVIAWIALSRQLTSAQRSGMLRYAEVEAARLDGAAAASLMADLGSVEISSVDAETAIDHLRQVSAAPADPELRGMVPMLWSTAIFVAMPDGRAVGDVDRVARDLEHAASILGEDSPDGGELLAMRAALLAARISEQPGASDSGQWQPVTDALAEAMGRLPAGHPMRSAEFDLLRHALGRQVDEADAADDAAARVETIMTALERTPRDDPGFARAMTSLSLQVLSLGGRHRSMLEHDRIVAQLETALTQLAPDDPLKRFAQSTYWGAIFARGVLRQRPDVVDEAIDELIRCAESTPADDVHRPWLLASVALALNDRHAMGGELRHLERAGEFIDRAFDAIGPEGPFAEGTMGHGVLLFIRGHLELLWCYYDPTPERVTRAIGDLERAAEVAEPGNPLSSWVMSSLETARFQREIMTTSPEHGMHLGTDSRETLAKLLAAAESMSHDHPEFPSLVAQAASGLMLRGLADNDLRLIDRAISLIGDACAIGNLAVHERSRLLTLHGQALCTRYTRTRSPRDLSNAIDRLEEARRAVEQEIGSPYAADALQTLAAAYRLRGDALRGDVDRAVTMGLAGLREHAGDVLLQNSDENALYVARRGTSDASEMARWFLDRGREAEAIEALELGRGMVLHAATSGAGLEQALREAGHTALADEWSHELSRDAQPGETGDLRYRIMLAIERSPAEARLLSPPALSDIAGALTESGAQALAYLLPRDDSGPGVGILVDPDGTVRSLPLPGLYAGPRSPVTTFLRTRRSAEAAATSAEAEAESESARAVWLDALSTLCDWAWRVAAGPLIQSIPARRGKERRIVLVPCGELGLVPWHAARRPGGDRYACQDAVFSYAASARQFVDAMRRSYPPWEQVPVLVSDSEVSLYVTAAGIAHLYDEYYPAASVFGYARHWLAPEVPGLSAATPGDVLASLPHGDFPGASVLHFGCHGQVQVPVLDSSLNLGVGGQVAVRDILRQARARPTNHESACGLVVLASCLTDVTEADYDEALTLATAFLTAGAAGVLAARWKVANSETALFMAMFHHHLNVSRHAPAEALHKAQLWMLDPGRAVPDGLPRVLRDEARMAGKPGGPDLASPAAWAGFAYQGR